MPVNGVRARTFSPRSGRLTGRNRRRYGGYIIHLSMMLMAIGIIGIESFQVETQGRIGVGESLKLSNYTVTYKELASWDDATQRRELHSGCG